jgi:hypothetical protein
MQREPKPPGRPPIRQGEPSKSVHLRVSTSQYDRLEQRADASRLTVPEVIRRRLDDDDDSDE